MTTDDGSDGENCTLFSRTHCLPNNLCSFLCLHSHVNCNSLKTAFTMHTAYLASRIFASPSIQSETIFTHFTLRKLLTQFSHFVGVGRSTFFQLGSVCVPCFVKLIRVARPKKNCATTKFVWKCRKWKFMKLTFMRRTDSTLSRILRIYIISSSFSHKYSTLDGSSCWHGMIYEFKIISMDNWQLSTTLHHFVPSQWVC